MIVDTNDNIPTVAAISAEYSMDHLTNILNMDFHDNACTSKSQLIWKKNWFSTYKKNNEILLPHYGAVCMTCFHARSNNSVLKDWFVTYVWW